MTSHAANFDNEADAKQAAEDWEDLARAADEADQLASW